MTPFSAWTIAVGQWFFRYRNAAFPIMFALIILVARPRVLFGAPALDRALVAGGVGVALLGQAVRLLTIGFDYIERGGKNKQVSASRLVQSGVYAHTRNPMYLGNFLIAVGIAMVSGAPAAYLIVIPLFGFIYQAIMVAEEAFLRRKFGEEYEAYCRRVPRLLPKLQGWRRTVSRATYDWRRAVRKDLSTITGLLLGLICLPLWRTYFLDGFEAARARVPGTVAGVAVVLVLYVVLHALKKHRLLLYLPAELK
jgi:protein-S-isoprenylcysteine O-methyltransferase Ste14